MPRCRCPTRSPRSSCSCPRGRGTRSQGGGPSRRRETCNWDSLVTNNRWLINALILLPFFRPFRNQNWGKNDVLLFCTAILSASNGMDKLKTKLIFVLYFRGPYDAMYLHTLSSRFPRWALPSNLALFPWRTTSARWARGHPRNGRGGRERIGGGRTTGGPGKSRGQGLKWLITISLFCSMLHSSVWYSMFHD